MFERHKIGTRAIATHVGLGRDHRAPQLEAEFLELVRASGADVAAEMHVNRRVAEPRYLIGEGKAEALREGVRLHGAELVIIDYAMSPAQERNLERLIECRVLDRIGLILDIFAQRAASFEGKLQVELAQLRHLSTRLVRGWTHLERQKGGIGLRGPGEKQLETDRRLLSERIKQINRRLDTVVRRRQLSRRSRANRELPLVSLVGYTNAGKSTLFNALADASVLAADQLFATLDTTVRRLALPNKDTVLLADTVGFIRDLPHELVAAFRATLEETRNASLLLHVIDASSPERDDQAEEVERVLRQMGIDDIEVLEVYNKVDALDGREPRVERDADGRIRRVWLSAHSGAGIELLVGALDELLSEPRVQVSLLLAPSDGRLRATLYERGTVHHERVTEHGGFELDVELRRSDFNALEKKERLSKLIVGPSSAKIHRRQSVPPLALME